MRRIGPPESIVSNELTVKPNPHFSPLNKGQIYDERAIRRCSAVCKDSAFHPLADSSSGANDTDFRGAKLCEPAPNFADGRKGFCRGFRTAATPHPKKASVSGLCVRSNCALPTAGKTAALVVRYFADSARLFRTA